jgi:F-type H+-transporting ATPase subunit b
MTARRLASWVLVTVLFGGSSVALAAAAEAEQSTHGATRDAPRAAPPTRGAGRDAPRPSEAAPARAPGHEIPRPTEPPPPRAVATAHDAPRAPQAVEPEHGPAHAATEHGAEHGAEEHAPAPINWFDFSNKAQPPYAAMLINFGLLLAIYYFFGKKPIGDALQNRRATVAKEIEEAQRMKREAEARAERYQTKLSHLEEELAATRQALLDAGKGERDRIIKEAEEKAARMQRDAMFRIEQELKQVRQEILQETIDVTVAAAEELLRRRVTPADQERLAEDYLAEITAKASGTASAARGGLS